MILVASLGYMLAVCGGAYCYKGETDVSHQKLSIREKILASTVQLDDGASDHYRYE